VAECKAFRPEKLGEGKNLLDPEWSEFEWFEAKSGQVPVGPHQVSEK
jgi:hypothetical protein